MERNLSFTITLPLYTSRRRAARTANGWTRVWEVSGRTSECRALCATAMSVSRDSWCQIVPRRRRIHSGILPPVVAILWAVLTFDMTLGRASALSTPIVDMMTWRRVDDAHVRELCRQRRMRSLSVERPRLSSCLVCSIVLTLDAVVCTPLSASVQHRSEIQYERFVVRGHSKQAYCTHAMRTVSDKKLSYR